MSIRRTAAKGVNVLTTAVALVQVATLLVGGVKALVRAAKGISGPER